MVSGAVQYVENLDAIFDHSVEDVVTTDDTASNTAVLMGGKQRLAHRPIAEF